MPPKVATQYHKELLPSDLCTVAYEELRDTVQWIEGVRSKKGFTRLARPLEYGENPTVDALIQLTMQKLATSITLLGIYVNYYKDGTHWTPNHTHPGTKQIIVSLGATRTLCVGKKDYQMGNGDVAVFGSATHGIAKEPDVAEGRISIALVIAKI